MKTKKIDSGTNSDIGILVDDLLPRWSGAGGGGEATAREGAPACGLCRVSPPSSTSASAERRCVASVELMRVVELLLVVELEVLHVLVPSVELWCVIVDGGGVGQEEDDFLGRAVERRWRRCVIVDGGGAGHQRAGADRSCLAGSQAELLLVVALFAETEQEEDDFLDRAAERWWRGNRRRPPSRSSASPPSSSCASLRTAVVHGRRLEGADRGCPGGSRAELITGRR